MLHVSMLMHFTIEQRHLIDERGKLVTTTSLVSFHKVDASSPDDAVRLFVDDHPGEVVGEIVTYPGFHAMATVRNAHGVYTLQVSPASERMEPIV